MLTKSGLKADLERGGGIVHQWATHVSLWQPCLSIEGIPAGSLLWSTDNTANKTS